MSDPVEPRPSEATASDRSRTPLLTLITQESLDRDYQVAASRRDPEDREPTGSRFAVVAVVAVFALLVTVAAVQTSRNADVDNASRSSLVERIESVRGLVADLQEEVARLREENAAAEEELRSLGERYSTVQARRSALGALTGFEAVTGDGVRVTVDNAPGAGSSAQVRDSDLALLVDGLWAAGAEAVALNGQRLTARSAIRNSGRAVEVNSVGIAPPYTVTALGDPRTLAADLLTGSPSGLAFVALAQQYGFRYDVDRVSDVRLPAAPTSLRRLRFAEQRTSSPKGEAGGQSP
ncbi:DUF881 domain-containing protein [Nocardioides sp. SYSU DS0651]|uniref:DUF881 domain-containing protein n=1 Tax=Nocardioides sp. SYSU DS0651 TaxID=3415955 RepID=UPI003F4BF005